MQGAVKGDEEDERTVILNWSGTHECRPAVIHLPESLAEVEALVAQAHADGTKLRPMVRGHLL
jgi:FAD/FMN-containing dehydrogenase